MSFTDEELYQAIGLVKEEKTAVPLLSDSQRDSLLEPDKPWYAKTRNQVGSIVAAVGLISFAANGFFSGSGTTQPKVAVAPVSDTQNGLLGQQLQAAQDGKTKAQRDAINANQQGVVSPAVAAMPVKKTVTTKPVTPPPRYVTTAPVPIRQSPPRVIQVVREAPVQRSSPAYSAPARVYAAAPPKDPMQRWQEAASMGTYGGGGSGQTVASVPATSVPAASNVSDNAFSGLQNGGSPPSSGYQPAIYNNPSTNDPQSVQSQTVQDYPSNTAFSSGLGVMLPMGSVGKAELQQPLFWSVGQSNPDIPVFLKLVSPFKDRTGKSLLEPGIFLTGKITNTTEGCDFTLDVSEINKNQIAPGAISANERASYKRQGGVGIGGRIASGLLNTASQIAQRQDSNSGLGVAVGANVVGSLIGAGQDSLSQSQYSGRQSATCKLGEGHTIKLLVKSDVQ
jgi:hypothetical protein